MAISSLDQLLAANAAGQTFKYVWTKQNPTLFVAASKWWNTATWSGNPPGMIYNAQQYIAASNQSEANQLIADSAPYAIGTIPTGGPVAPYTKYLSSIEVHTSVASGVPCWLMLVDLLMYYPNINTNLGGLTSASQQTLTNSVTLPRYTTGAGVQMFLECNTANSTTASWILQGANCTFSGTGTGSTGTIGTFYTNSAGTVGQTIAGGDIPYGVVANPGVFFGSATASPHSVAVGTIASQPTAIIHSTTTTGINCVSPFLPLATGDKGIQSVQTIQFSAANTGLSTLILCKPIVQIPLHQAAFYPSGRDFVFNMPTLPIIYDGACLAFLLYAGNTVLVQYANFTAILDFVWG